MKIKRYILFFNFFIISIFSLNVFSANSNIIVEKESTYQENSSINETIITSSNVILETTSKGMKVIFDYDKNTISTISFNLQPQSTVNNTTYKLIVNGVEIDNLNFSTPNLISEANLISGQNIIEINNLEKNVLYKLTILENGIEKPLIINGVTSADGIFEYIPLPSSQTSNIPGILTLILLIIVIALIGWILYLYLKKHDKKSKKIDITENKNEMERLSKRQEKNIIDDHSLFLEKILPIIDKYNLTINSIKSKNPETIKITQGFKMISKNLEDALNKENIEIINPILNGIVDQNMMKIIGKAKGDGISGTIAKILKPGYVLNDKVISKAEVIIFE